MALYSILAAGFAPARGFPPNQVIPASIVAVLLTLGVALAVVRYRQGRFAALDRAAARMERVSGLPRWAALPIAMTTVSLLVAVFGFYWDVAWHIDKGRDNGPFSTPAHYPIIIGLLGIAIAGVASLALDTDDHPHGVRLPKLGRVSVGGTLLTLCGLVALAGFPLDDVWHTLFGQDVTLWGPTHIQMIGGASLATIAAWILREEGNRRAPDLHRNALDRPGIGGRLTRYADIAVGGAVLIGLSTLQGEFDFGVPQFRAVYHPLLIMLAAGIALVAARVRTGRGGALAAALLFIAVRGTLTVLIGPILGRTTLHFPLYLAEAVLVELIALVVSTRRQILFGVVSGLAIGTIGLAAEWGWSQIWMPLPWRSAMWPLGAILGFVAAVCGGALGGAMGRALLPPGAARQRSPRLLLPLAWAGALATIVVAMPMSAHDYKATVTLKDVNSGAQRSVVATVKLDPPQAADRATWFDLTSWQGGNGLFQSSIVGQWVVPLHEVSPGVYQSTTPVPVYGKWKTLLRLATVDSLQAVPIYMPADPAIPAKAVPAPATTFTRTFVPDKQVLQREAVGGSVTLQRIAYVLLALIGLIWIAGIAFGLRRLDRSAASELRDPPNNALLPGAGRIRTGRRPRSGTASAAV